MGGLFRSFLFGKNVAVIIFAISFLSATVNGKMPRKRDLFLSWFNRLQNPSPAPAVQQASSSNVGSTSTSLAQPVPSTSHPQLSQAGSPGALVSLVPQVTSSAPPSNSTVKEAANVAWEGVKTALVLLKEGSGWFPPLKSAIGGFLALIDATEQCGRS